MALLVFNPSVAPSPGTKDRPEVKRLEAEFGDGYTQFTGDGMNNVRRVLSLQWDKLTLEQADEIEGFIVARKGYEDFLYTPSDEAKQLKWSCKEWDRTKGKNVHSISATFRQSFNLGA